MTDAAKIIEPRPVPATLTDEELLAYRLRQQSVLTQFGRRALEASDCDQLFSDAVQMCAEGMQAAFCKLLQYVPEQHKLLVRAGVGWRPGVIGHETLPLDRRFPAGFSFKTGQAVISNHLEHEEKFETPPLLKEHGVKRSLNVPVTLARGVHWGVLAADSPRQGQFDGADIEFMRGMAQILGAAIQRLRNEEALRESEEQFRTMADALPQLAWMADPDGSIYWYNQRWYEYTGMTLDEASGWGWRDVHHPDHLQRVVERIQHSWDTGEPWEDTFPLRGADGRYRWFLSRAVPLRDADGRVTRWFGTNTDITERQKLEEFQALLIREISHRVKNSLALVSALLNLQARTLDGASRTALEDAALRVQAVATVHDQLFRQEDAREVDLKPFLCNLASAVSSAAPELETKATIDPATVSADMAVPIGLLVNELVTNAYKYAYPEGAEGEVRIIGKQLDEGRYQLEVSDSGCGLPADFDINRASSSNLGMRVVTSLSRQLGGDMIMESAEPGVRFRIEFPTREPTAEG
jgi:two-component system, sensor histidine kinase PdtaS